MRLFSFILLVFMLLVFSSCGAAEGTLEVVSITECEPSDDVVCLEDIRPPKFGEDFATLIAGTTKVVYWGIGGTNVMSRQSGYPGFGYPMIIYSDVDPSGTATIVVQWGMFEYGLEMSGTAFAEDNNLVDSSSGERLANWGVKKEDLIIWDPISGDYSLYNFIGGTEIVD